MKYFFLLCCLIPTLSIAQTRNEDSLLKIIASQGNDSNKVNSLLKAYEWYSGEDTAQKSSYAREALSLSEQIGFGKGKAMALKSIGMNFFGKSQYLEALTYWLQSLQQFEKDKDIVGQANMLSNVGAVYQLQGVDDRALEYFLKSLKKSEESGNKKRIMTALQNIGSLYAHKKATYDKALSYYRRALPLEDELKDLQAIGTTTVNMGEIYLDKGKADSARIYFQKSLKAFLDNESAESSGATPDRAYSLYNLGRASTLQKNYTEAINFHQQAFDIAKLADSKLYMCKALQGIAENEYQLGNISAALVSYKNSESLADQMKSNYDLKDIYQGLTGVYATMKDFPTAFKYQSLLGNIKDTIYNLETDKKLGNLLFDFDIEKKQGEINLLTKDKALQTAELNRQKFAKNALIVGFTLVFIIAFIIYRDYRQKIRINKILDNQKLQIETLLLNILPKEVALELQEKGEATPRFYEKASVLFTDFKSFSALADQLSPQEVVTELNECFIEFDNIIRKYKLEKIKTIGDSYMCAGGIPTPDDDHILNIVKASLEIQEYIKARNIRRINNNLPPWDIRIGINTGPLVAGVVGKIKYAYDIWGGTVNVASRMESNGEPGKVNISSATYELIKDRYACTYRGKIFAKNIGEIDMYFINHEIA